MPQYVEIKSNVFDRNQGGFSFYKEAEMPRASQIFVNGVAGQTVISQNEFRNMTQQVGKEFFNMIEVNLTSYFEAMFPGYWDKPQTPLIHVTVPSLVNARLETTLYNTTTSLVPYNTSDDRILSPLSELVFEENLLSNYSSVQPLIASNKYRGSILNYISESIYSRVRLNSNVIKDCSVIGSDAALFFISGGSLSAFNNTFERIGSLTNLTFKQPTTKFLKPLPLPPGLDYTEPMQYAAYFGYPYYPGSVTNLTMDRGIFWTEAGRMNATNWTQPMQNEFEANSFDSVFCHQGCIYSQTIKKDSHPTLVKHFDNSYRNIYGITGSVKLL